MVLLLCFCAFAILANCNAFEVAGDSKWGVNISGSGMLQIPFPNLNGTLSFEFWFAMESLELPSQTLMEHSMAFGPQGTDFRMEVLSSGKLRFTMGDGNQTAIQIISSASIKPQKWYHIAVSVEHRNDLPLIPSQVVLYFNGQRDAVSGWHSERQRLQLENVPIVFGSCECTFDEIRIWSIFRFEPQIASQRSRKLTKDTPNLVAYYDLDEGQGTSVTANEQNIGQIVGGNWVISGALINVFTTINLPKAREYTMITLTGFSDSNSQLYYAIISYPQYGSVYEVEQDSTIGQRVTMGMKLPTNVVAYIWDPVYSDITDSFEFTVSASNTSFLRDTIASSVIYLSRTPSCDEVPGRSIDDCGVCGGDGSHCLCPTGFNDYRGYPLQDVDKMAAWYAASFTREIFVKMQSIILNAIDVLDSDAQFELGDVLPVLKDIKSNCIEPLFESIASIQ